MGTRSRKRRLAGAHPGAGADPAATEERPAGATAAAADDDEPRSGATAADADEPRSGAPPPGDGLRRGYARGRARDDEIRAGLEPLAPGERPRALTVAAFVAFAFAIADLAAALSGNDISSGGDPSIGTAVRTILLLVAGFGMLARQYWAVLGFQAILALQIVLFSLVLLGVQKLWHAIIPLVAIGLLGLLFWKLVRAMARLQMPARPPADPAP